MGQNDDVYLMNAEQLRNELIRIREKARLLISESKNNQHLLLLIVTILPYSQVDHGSN